jgi:hypothetical protein
MSWSGTSRGVGAHGPSRAIHDELGKSNGDKHEIGISGVDCFAFWTHLGPSWFLDLRKGCEKQSQ